MKILWPVFCQDLGWLTLVLTATGLLPLRRPMLTLLRIVAAYIAVEMLFHGLLEAAVAHLL